MEKFTKFLTEKFTKKLTRHLKKTKFTIFNEFN